MQSNKYTIALSKSVPTVGDISDKVANSEDKTRTEKSGYRLALIAKPLWFRLVVSLGFVVSALSATGLFWMVVDRPISAPLFLVAIVASAWLCGFRAGVFATVVSGFIIDFFFVPPFYEFNASRDEIVRFLIFFAE